MNIRGIFSVVIVVLLFSRHSEATTYFVNASNAVPALPFSTWNTAATNIQDAIDASTNGDVVLVTNGIYQFGGTVMAGNLTNRVALNKPVTVQSVNGPWVTIIQGMGATNGTAAVRCAWLTNGAFLSGFTLQAGATRNSGDVATLESGGGVWCASSNATVANCVIQYNNAASQGGGIYQGTVRNSLIVGNGATSTGGAALKTVMISCTVVSNLTTGVSGGNYTNCILFYNMFNNYFSAGPMNYCCTTPSPGGVGNITAAPQLFSDGVHLTLASPCLGAGTNLVTGTDIFGQAWANPPSMGCAEGALAPLVTKPQIQLTGSPVGFTVGNATYIGQTPFYFSWLKDGVTLSDNGHFSSTQTTNLIVTGVNFSDAGNYQFVVSNAFGVVTSTAAPLIIHCVDIAGTNPITPYLAWSNAATNIQDAITAAVAGDVVLVTNGLYATGGKSMDGLITNRVSVDKAILVQSVNGPGASVIQGAWDPSTNGPVAVRCVWMTTNAILSGFTLRGGATLAVSTDSYKQLDGGGVLGVISSTVANCVVKNNAAATGGAGAYGATLLNCQIMSNSASGIPGYGLAANGGGANSCTLIDCTVAGNYALTEGGGTASSLLKNCAIMGNSAGQQDGGAYGGALINCTVTKNVSLSTTYNFGGGVGFASLTNCIVYGNQEAVTSPSSSNYYNCTFSFSCSSPLPGGINNLGVNPQLLADGVHLTATSPCLGAGNAGVVSGTDIDGQPWNNPPSIGCDEWWPAPVISAPLVYQINSPAHGLTFNTIVAGQSPFTFFWSKDGQPIQDDGHHSNSGTASLVVNNFGPADAGIYQVVATNASGIATSSVVQVVIHAVDATGANPLAPYSSWATAATTIQDAINSAATGDIVLVTNGIYAVGGMAKAGGLTNRVAVNLPIAVVSVNGYSATVIQGVWDPIATNGPGAVRCAYVADGALLNGFTLANGATLATGDAFTGGPLESGGGVWCNSTNGVVSNCVLTNNSAVYGGGILNGTLNNSLVLYNLATFGGGAYGATLNNCTVVNNYSTTPYINRGAGTYGGIVNNSIVVNNYDSYPSPNVDNYSASSGLLAFAYCCTSPSSPGLPLPSGAGNINVNPHFLDWFHIAAASPCRGAGSALYASGTDLDAESWANPPSIGCDEVVVTNLVGPLLVSVVASQTNLLVNRYDSFSGFFTGRASSAIWTFGDGQMVTNPGVSLFHEWTNAGNYSLTFTVYNNDNPAGVATNIVISVQALAMPQLQPAVLSTNGFQFQFAGQLNANYTVQYTTNLAPAVTWQTLQMIYNNSASLLQITDPNPPTGTRFYRVLVQ